MIFYTKNIKQIRINEFKFKKSTIESLCTIHIESHQHNLIQHIFINYSAHDCRISTMYWRELRPI